MDWLRQLPKAELHLHIEGSLEPEMLFAFAARNGVDLPFDTVEAVRAAYRFQRLDDFLAIYYQGMAVLQTRDDFRELTFAYMQRARADGVRHAEIFFDPQGHTRRGIAFETVIGGITDGLQEAGASLGVTSRLIMCFLRDLSEDDALQTLEQAEPYLEHLTGVGLDSAEVGHPPGKFSRVFAAARARGLRLVAHAGEEGPPEYVREALDVLQIDRLDHGNRSLEDPALVERLRASQMTLTVCPLSNLKLGGVADLRQHPLKRMLELGLRATVNSDDPAYFGGYVLDNFVAAREALGLERQHIVTLAKNSFSGSFLDEKSVEGYLREIDAS
ncbi:MAG: adenosine deaminase [Steroidobacteraceae bacterium]